MYCLSPCLRARGRINKYSFYFKKKNKSHFSAPRRQLLIVSDLRWENWVVRMGDCIEAIKHTWSFIKNKQKTNKQKVIVDSYAVDAIWNRWPHPHHPPLQRNIQNATNRTPITMWLNSCFCYFKLILSKNIIFNSISHLTWQFSLVELVQPRSTPTRSNWNNASSNFDTNKRN